MTVQTKQSDGCGTHDALMMGEILMCMDERQGNFRVVEFDLWNSTFNPALRLAVGLAGHGFRPAALWGVYAVGDGPSVAHNHSDLDLTVLYYPRDAEGDLCFDHDHSGALPEPVTPRAGLLVRFPGSLPHWITRGGTEARPRFVVGVGFNKVLSDASDRSQIEKLLETS